MRKNKKVKVELYVSSLFNTSSDSSRTELNSPEKNRQQWWLKSEKQNFPRTDRY